MERIVGDERAVKFYEEPKLFGKWDYKVKVADKVFVDQIAVSTTRSQVFVPHTAGRYQLKPFRKLACPIVERLVNCVQFKGRNSGKKAQAIRIVKVVFDIIYLMTRRNPIEILIEAACKGGAREDRTRLGSGGGVKRQAVDVAPMRRLSQSLFFMCMGVRKTAMRSSTSYAECLAKEIIATANGTVNPQANGL